jgi:iron complex outermembrane receptor protein
MIRNPEIARAVRFALLTSTVAAASAISLPAQAQTQGASASPPVVEEVVITGSRIRRIEAETADPIVVVDSSAIQASGATTLGDIIQRIPEMAGAAVNPQVNNGGGFGESNISLRGLGGFGVAVEPRVVILIDGRRYGLIGASGASDVNVIPANIIERVEVLKEGAGAVYGSDAIAGVVNFITKKNIEGAQTGFQFTETSRHDGQAKIAGVLMGTRTDKLNLTFGGNYTQQNAVTAANRDYSKNALGLYSGSVIIGGSSRTIGGRYFLNASPANLTPAQAAQQASLRAMYAAAAGTTVARCSSITKIAGQSGASLSDYRCFSAARDNFNFQPYNLILTPQERGALFTNLNYTFNDYVEAYAEVLYNRTRSAFQIAPLPFDTKADNVVISADNIYNPFGLNFGGLAPTPWGNATVRSTQNGDRTRDTTSDTKLAYVGFHGRLPTINWDWNLGVNYGRLDQAASTSGYFFLPLTKQALGPSMLVNGVPTCVAVAGNPATAIGGCTPVNFFGINDPSQASVLQGISAAYSISNVSVNRGASLDFSGKVYDLPAGALMGAVGIDYEYQRGVTARSYDATALPPRFLSCQLSSETCAQTQNGNYSQKEAYGEVLVPVLRDLPGVKALNLSAGVRYSDYSNFGGTTRGQLKLEYRPISDVLARGTFAQVFRAPAIGDLFAGPANNAPTFADPCTGLTAVQAAGNPAYATLCRYVPQNGTFQPANSQVTGITAGNPSLKPEVGNVLTYGLVYDVSALPGLSADVDFWRYKLDSTISLIDVNFAARQCLATNSPTFCGYFNRDPSSGQILFISQPTNNLGQLKTSGIDFGLKYVLKNTPIGGWRFSLDATKVKSFQTTAAPGASPVDIVGQYDRQFGNFAKWRAYGQAGWSYKGFDGLVTARFIDKVDLLHPDAGSATAPGYVVGPLKVPSLTYVDLNLAYTFRTKTRLSLGVTNLGDRQPPIMYNTNVINANTDVQTYDLLGRRYFVGLSQSF